MVEDIDCLRRFHEPRAIGVAVFVRNELRSREALNVLDSTKTGVGSRGLVVNESGLQTLTV